MSFSWDPTDQRPTRPTDGSAAGGERNSRNAMIVCALATARTAHLHRLSQPHFAPLSPLSTFLPIWLLTRRRGTALRPHSARKEVGEERAETENPSRKTTGGEEADRRDPRTFLPDSPLPDRVSAPPIRRRNRPHRRRRGKTAALTAPAVKRSQ